MSLLKILRGMTGLAFLACMTTDVPSVVAQELFGSATGLPLPRFVSVGSTRVNVRTGPGKEYPIRWVFTRPDIPIQITDESDAWRKILDYEGESGWVHNGLVNGDRNIMVTGEIRNLYRTPSDQAIVIARLEPGVLGELINCEPAYCFIDVRGRRGWLPREHFWGILLDEVY